MFYFHAEIKSGMKYLSTSIKLTILMKASLVTFWMEVLQQHFGKKGSFFQCQSIQDLCVAMEFLFSSHQVSVHLYKGK